MPKSFVFALSMFACGFAAAAEPLELKKGDHICFIGNSLAERMQHYGWLETLLHAQFPQHELVIRNLGYSADEIDGWQNPSHRLRSRDFGSQDEWLAGNAPVPQPTKLGERDKGKHRNNRFELTNTKADVIFAFYGYNESWAGEQGLPKFKENIAAFIDHTLGQKYNGRSAPKLVLFAPPPMIKMDDPNLPTEEQVKAANGRLKLYSTAMGEVAKSKNILFVDLFTLLSPKAISGVGTNSKAGLQGEIQLAGSNFLDGVHVNNEGDRAVAQEIFAALFPGQNLGSGKTREQLEPLRQTVLDKNFYWYNRYRVTDGYSTYGDRAFLRFAEGGAGYGEGLSNYTVGQRELDVLDVLTTNRDRVIWDAANGKKSEPYDKDLPEFVPVISNKPGPLDGGKHIFLSGEDAIGKMTIDPKLRVELFASEEKFPEMANPVQMAFDTKGRLWVACWPTYPHWKPTEPMNDKLLILEDTDGDGKADVCKTFAGDIHNPTGFEFWNNGVLVAQGPDLLFLKDTDGDDKYDVKERVLGGLDTADTHHTANSFILDPGGALYFQEGTFHHSQIETVWGPPRRVANGAVFRYEPRAQKIDVYVSYGFANPHGHVFDRWGQDIVWDGTGAQPYHAVLFSGDVDFPHKHGGTPQVYQQRTRPCSGTEILATKHFPDDWQQNLLVLNVIGFQGILRYKVEDKDSSFTAVEQEPVLSSSDPNFRPTDIETAPDGSVYFVDWQNPIIGHMQHNLRDPSRDREHGRVYRITCKDRELVKPAKIAGEPVEKLLELLKSDEARVRYRTRIELSGRDPKKVELPLLKWLAALDKSDPEYEHHRLEALWLFQNLNIVAVPLLKEELRSPDFRVRAAATRVLNYWRDRVPDVLELLQVQINDEQPRVRLMAIWGLSFFDGPAAAKAAEIVVEALIHPDDAYIKHALSETNKTLDRRVQAAGK